MVDVVVELLILLDDLPLPEEQDTDLLHQDDELVAHPGNIIISINVLKYCRQIIMA